LRFYLHTHRPRNRRRVRFRETQHGNVPATHLMLFPASVAPALMVAPSGRYTIVPIVRSAVCSRGSSRVGCGRYDRNRPPVENLAYSVMTIAPASWHGAVRVHPDG